MAIEERSKEPEVKRTLGVFSIVLMCVAAAAPLTVVAGTQPLVMTYTGNISIPVYYLATGIILAVFSAGFTTMSNYVPNAGAFYSYIQAGMGRKIGMGSATMALMAYVLIMIAVLAYMGYATSAAITLFFPAIELPWWVCAFAWWVVILYLGYHNIDLSSKVLGVFLILEVLSVTILDVACVVNGQPGSALESFSPANFMSGNPGLGLMWAFFGFIGFEATAVFKKEAKDPEKTIPRATYATVAFIALFYGISALCLVAGVGSEGALAFAMETQDAYALELAAQFVGAWLYDVIQILLVTSLFACTLSLHNVASRYVFMLSSVRVLPEALGKIHPKHFAPSVASLSISVFSLILLVIVTIVGLDPLVVYAWFANTATLCLVLLQLLTSISVVLFFRTHESKKGAFHTVIAPVLSAIGLAFVALVIVMNFVSLTGSVMSAIIMGVLVPISFAIGFIVSAGMQKKNPTQYENLSTLVLDEALAV